MIKVFLALAVILHGLANLSGAFAPFTQSAQGFSDQAWIFSGGVTFRGVGGRLFAVVWALSSLFLVGAGVGLLIGQSWWWLAAIVGSACSLAAILPWWQSIPLGARLAAIFDVGMLAVLLSPLGRQIVQQIN